MTSAESDQIQIKYFSKKTAETTGVPAHTCQCVVNERKHLELKADTNASIHTSQQHMKITPKKKLQTTLVKGIIFSRSPKSLWHVLRKLVFK
jgi:hypothetical protein